MKVVYAQRRSVTNAPAHDVSLLARGAQRQRVTETASATEREMSAEV